MYNRYIPQPDGSHKCSRIPDPTKRRPPAPPPPILPPKPECPPPKSECPPPKPPPPPREKPSQGTIGHFLRRILPGNFDTADLIVVLLLLLMAADSAEEQNTALLTLALYLII